IAEWISEDIKARERLRELFHQQGVLESHVLKGKEVEGAKYKDYFDYSEPAAKVPSHRMLAIRRGEKEEILSFRIQPPAEQAVMILEGLFLKAKNPNGIEVKHAVADSYQRLLSSSLEAEYRLARKKAADEKAIETFKTNLREL